MINWNDPSLGIPHSYYRLNHGVYPVLLSFYFMEWGGECALLSIPWH